MKLSRSRLSEASVFRSKVIFESAVKLPSALSRNVPVPPVAVRTAAEGSDTPTSCSRTLTVAFEAAVTVQTLPLAAAVGDVIAGAGVADGVGVAVGVVVETVAPPPQATSATAARARITRSAREPFIVGVACTNQSLCK